MDEDTQALTPVAEETAQTESPTVEQTTEDTPVETPKKGAQARIREVISENHSLKEKIAKLTSQATDVPQMPYQPQQAKPLVSPDETIDAQELERRMQERMLIERQQTLQLVDFKTRQAQAIDRINRESAEVVSQYKELDPESDSFDQELNDAIYEAVEAKVKADPTASVKDFVKKQMRLYKREAAREEAQTNAVIAKQSAQGAIRPTQAKPVENKNFGDLSIEEMRARLGYAQ